MSAGLPEGALATARAIAAGELSAAEVARAAIARAEALNPKLNALTAITADRALAEAAAIDARRARGEPLPMLAGAPYVAKNLFDIEGLTTLAGSKINRDQPPARQDAVLVERMRAAGAVLVGAAAMDEYAYGFTTENTHYGPTRNPHDPSRVAGGSSGGSGAAVGAAMTPLALGSDTNGSIRVPSSFCGIWGLKPTYGRLSRRGAFPFCASLDHVGPFARNVADLAACYDALQGPDVLDPACGATTVEPALPALDHDTGATRCALLSGWFEQNAHPEALAARDAVAAALGVTRRLELPEVARARASAFVITASESANLHFANLKTRARDFEPLIRDRLLAGALVPAHWVLSAQRFRAWFHSRVQEVFREAEVLIAPSTPFAATPIGTETIEIGGRTLPLRPSLGLLTQPISFIGLPVVAAPVATPVAASAGLPLGVQLIGAPGSEARLLALAARLERAGVCAARAAPK